MKNQLFTNFNGSNFYIFFRGFQWVVFNAEAQARNKWNTTHLNVWMK